jgi:hypothetical protein
MRLATVILVVFGASLGNVQGAAADDEPPAACSTCPDAEGWVDGGLVRVRARDKAAVPQPGRGTEVSTVANPCRYAAAEESWDPYVDQIVADYFDSGARWYQVDCNGDGMVYRWFVPGEDDGAGPEALLREVVQAAFGSVDAGVGRLRLAPVDPAPHITGLPSWLAIEPEDFTTRSASVTAGTITVTATLEPRRVMWTLGDGGETSCEGPGTVYDTSRSYESQSTDCTYTYAVASTLDDPDGSYAVSAFIVYGASFTVVSPLAELNGTFDLGELDGPPTSQDIVVRQIQAVRTSG